MTCASCVARVEKRLERIPGVTARVNLVTENAVVEHPDTVAVDELVDAVARAGYDATPLAPSAGPAGPAGLAAPASAVEPPVPPASTGSAMPGGQQGGPGAAPGIAPCVPERVGRRAGAASRADTTTDPYRRRAIVTGVLAVPVVLLSMVPALQFDFWQWLCLALTVPIVVWGGAPFHRAAVRNLRHGAVTMDTLISIGTLAAFLWSVYALTLGGAGVPGMHHEMSVIATGHHGAQIYLEVSAAVTFFLLLGRSIETRAKRSAGAALGELAALQPSDVAVPVDPDPSDPSAGRAIRTIAVRELAVGDLFLARQGERVAADAEAVSGGGVVDASVVTGESLPIEVSVGDTVLAGSLVASGVLTLRATRTGDDSEMARVAAMVERAQSEKSRIARIADRVSGVFVPVVLVVAAATLVGWLASGAGAATAVEVAVAVLIVACPCALGLAIPVALVVGTARGAELGIAITGPEALENAGAVTTLYVDKTGTLTEGAVTVTAAALADGAEEGRLRALVGAVESLAVHPVASALVRWAEAGAAGSAGPAGPVQTVPPDVEVEDCEVLPGEGVRATVRERGRAGATPVAILSPSAAGSRGATLDDRLAEAVDASAAAGESCVLVLVDGAAVAVLALADRVRPETPSVLARLGAAGVRVVILSGDAPSPVAAVADRLGVAEWHAQLSPTDKAARVSAAVAAGERVAMLGDGVNDAAALASATLGIAVGTGTAAAARAADITIVGGGLRPAVDAILLSRRMRGIIVGNLFWAFAYNVAAIPVAALGLLTPMLAGAAMAFSSVFVVLNSLRLRRYSGVADRA
ncbi:cation-translocating P-type ATPase [Mycetocola reblochoni]|nr:cation-translocating P-type ATPase [Mycetocola reblochoni]